MKVLLWDIDGTLLRTGTAGNAAWCDAVAAESGREVSLDGFTTAGFTDLDIAHRLAAEHFSASPGVAERLLVCYLERLPGRLVPGCGRVLPNVREILGTAGGRPGLECALLTGNVERGGRAKLAHFGLADLFAWGAFADGTRDRDEVARRALWEARSRHRDGLEALLVIGDTPRDVACARAIGAPCLAVATGDFSRAELAATDPWRTLESLPTPPAFFAALERAPAWKAPAQLPAS
jgi:phosphoglycolate phosphatase-like HAD superfamily hydrolase